MASEEAVGFGSFGRVSEGGWGGFSGGERGGGARVSDAGEKWRG